MSVGTPREAVEFGGRYYRYDSMRPGDVNAESNAERAMKMRTIDEHCPQVNPVILADGDALVPALRER
jgi:hypothetical protein